jgi:hypothetical protein
MSDEDLHQMRRLLSEATERVGRDYFLLPVANGAGGPPLVQYRERVYAYELYHQLRSIWPNWPYSLAGEVDKRGHPVVRGGHLDDAKPDLLVHVPGVMNQNLLAVEIKAARPEARQAEARAIAQDLRKLAAFREVGYEGAMLLVFGEAIDRIRECVRQEGELRALSDVVELLHHQRPGVPATTVSWNAGQGENPR